MWRQWEFNKQRTTVQHTRETCEQAAPAHAPSSSIMMSAAASVAARHCPSHCIKAGPPIALTPLTFKRGLGPLTPVRPGEVEVVKAWPLFLAVSEVSSHSWGQGFHLPASGVIENCWPLRQATWPCLPPGLEEPSLVREPLAAAHPSSAVPE